MGEQNEKYYAYILYIVFWIIRYYTKTFYTYDSHPLVYNNTVTGFFRVTSSFGGGPSFYNNIFYDFDMPPSPGSDVDHPIIYGNNCFNQPFGYMDYIVDLGGNIVADPLFVDLADGDYSLQEGSPCIDSGLSIPGLPDVDIRYHKRSVSGANGGAGNPDMGAYEYNSVYFGGIRGVVFDPDSRQVIDCARIEIGHRLPEFSDTLGTFTYHTGPGILSVRASRWDYEDQIIDDIIVNEGELTIVAIPMYRANTGITDPETPEISPTIGLYNYPNPFNPSTTIRFATPADGKVKLTIYNIKGQKVKELLNEELLAGNHSIVWNGTDYADRSVSSGLYIARIEQGKATRVHKMMLIK